MVIKVANSYLGLSMSQRVICIFRYVNSFIFHSKIHKMSTIIIAISQERKVRHREVKYFTQSFTQSQTSSNW